MWTITDLAESQIKALAAEGISLTPQQVLDIQRLSLDATYPGWDAMLASGFSVRVCEGVVLHTLTIGAAYWYDNVRNGCGADAEKMFCLCYAMARARDPKIQTATLDDVEAWRRGLACSEGELFNASQKVLERMVNPLSVRQNDDEYANSLPGLVASAVSLCGGDPATWEWQCALPFVAMAVRKAYEDKAALAGAKVRHGDAAYAALGRYVMSLRKRKGESNG